MRLYESSAFFLNKQTQKPVIYPLPALAAQNLVALSSNLTKQANVLTSSDQFLLYNRFLAP